MPFEKVETQVDFPAQERDVLAFWERTDAFERLREKNRGKPKWSFLDGPITANNPMGVHHAWGRTYKDAYQRYFAMTGHELRYQNGFDCQGLWVEVEVEKALKLQSKRDIEELVPGDRFASIDRFVNECKERVNRFAKVQTEQSIRLGYWMDWDEGDDWKDPPDERRSYFTMADENNYTIWNFLKKCHTRGLIYLGYDAMPWCPRCAVGLSQQEMHEGYQMVAHRAVFVRFGLRDRDAESLLVWTTTPWTLTSNVAAAVNPELTYLKVKHRDHVYYLAKGAFTAQRLEEQFKRKEWVEGVPKLKTLEQIFKEKGGYEIVGEVKGADMVGWTYDGPFDELEAQNHPGGFPEDTADDVLKQGWTVAESAKSVHRVIGWNMVGETEGTGIVHIAPGCGKEDFALGKEQKLPPVAPLGEDGVFVPGFGALTGKSAVDAATADAVFESLTQKGLLLAIEKYPHSYPHCWRCKTELLFRLVDEWFINMSWREEIMRATEQVTFLPESINGKARELDWLRNMGDWMISKKRFWGLSLPIWVCESCRAFDVIGSKEELKARAVEGWDKFEGHSPHRPWVDLLKLKCAKCSSTMSRVPDVGNPWLDAGIVPFSTMGYNTDRESWKEWFPADFITECFPGQFRNWFYAILAMSTMMTQQDEGSPRAPFKVLLGHGLVRDQWGDEMHKSKGNSVPFEGAADGVELEGKPYKGYKIEHELKSGEQAVVPGAIEIEVGDLSAKDITIAAGADVVTAPGAVLTTGVSGAADVKVPPRTTLVVKGGGQKRVIAYCAPMGADLMRWMYCRQMPASNINFGPGPAEELRSKFILKLWNTYSFFTNYARLDDFDPAAAPVPVRERPDIDRWILSDLQLLVKSAHKAFQGFNVQEFCREAEKFVDDKLSNWYVRRNRRRFWKSDKGSDKVAAYQTLYTVLLTLAKLFAPIVPFLSEVMYRNLAAGADNNASVHLTDYPVADEALIDRELSDEMDALLELVTLGSAARNTVKIKVRQPLAELKIQPGSDNDRKAVERFADQIKEELNLKQVTLHVGATGPLLLFDVKPNMKVLGPKFGPKLGEVQAALAAADHAAIAAKVQAGESFELPLADGPVTLAPGDVVVQSKNPEGWAGVADGKTQVLLDKRITEELAREGKAREIIRHVQELRKSSDLQLEDRIVLHLGSDADALKQAIAAHGDYIGAETLAVELSPLPLPEGGVFSTEAKVDGDGLRIQLRRVERPRVEAAPTSPSAASSPRKKGTAQAKKAKPAAPRKPAKAKVSAKAAKRPVANARPAAKARASKGKPAKAKAVATASRKSAKVASKKGKTKVAAKAKVKKAPAKGKAKVATKVRKPGKK